MVLSRQTIKLATPIFFNIRDLVCCAVRQNYCSFRNLYDIFYVRGHIMGNTNVANSILKCMNMDSIE